MHVDAVGQCDRKIFCRAVSKKMVVLKIVLHVLMLFVWPCIVIYLRNNIIQPNCPNICTSFVFIITQQWNKQQKVSHGSDLALVTHKMY